MVTVSERRKIISLAATVFLSAQLLGGCTSVKYSYDTRMGFSEAKSYAWTKSTSNTYGESDLLLEANVQAFADQLLGQKGFNRAPENPDLLISMHYELEAGYSEQDYEIQVLTLNIYKSERRELIWRGTASGGIFNISTDTASSDLKKAVQGILSNFPPK